MRKPVAFYAPLKPPDHPVPSGDRRMARALIEALLWPICRWSWRAACAAMTGRAMPCGSAGSRRWAAGSPPGWRAVMPAAGRRAPARLADLPRLSQVARLAGPRRDAALAMPYLLAEASFAPKQGAAPGRWATPPPSARSAPPTWFWRSPRSMPNAWRRSWRRPPSCGGCRRSSIRRPVGRREERERHRRRSPCASIWTPAALAAHRGHDARRREARLLWSPGARPCGAAGSAWQLLAVGDGPARPEVRRCSERSATTASGSPA